MHPERVDVGRTEIAPVDEVDAELEGGLRASHHLGFVDSEKVVEVLHLRQRRFADADDADLFRFNQGHAVSLARQHRHKRCRGHPAGGTAAKDHDLQGLVHEPVSVPRQSRVM
jgi:hypothetical protein